MKPLAVSSDYHPKALRRFNNDTAEHEMEVLLDQDVYRHLRFKKPGTGMYYFDIITWPGNLAIKGDMGTYVFAREHDMFLWFNGSYVNAGYWGEKLQAIDRQCGFREHDEALFKTYIIEDFWERREEYTPEDAKEIWERIRDGILSDYEYRGSRDVCIDLIRDFRVAGFEFSDPWEASWEDYTPQFLWCCHAILSGIKHYFEAKAGADV